MEAWSIEETLRVIRFAALGFDVSLHNHFASKERFVTLIFATPRPPCFFQSKKNLFHMIQKNLLAIFFTPNKSSSYFFSIVSIAARVALYNGK